jgi:hypothetical protein
MFGTSAFMDSGLRLRGAGTTVLYSESEIPDLQDASSGTPLQVVAGHVPAISIP